jgi:hypothetical protein
MSEFDDIRTELAAAIAQAHTESRALFHRRQRIARLRQARREQVRRAPAAEGADAPALAELDARIAELETEIKARAAAVDRVRAAEREVLGRFEKYTDPRERIGELSGRTPILLMPLRIETRFKRAVEFGGESDELWVRVYPDDVMVDGFEDTLAVAEAQRVRTYWAEIWRAGGDEAGERGAWRGLLSGQGAGRARWLIDHYRPLNAADRPFKVEGLPTVILTIVTQAPPAEPARTAARDFWAATWRAGDDPTAQTAAIETLVSAVGAVTAEAMRRDTLPRNLADPPPEGTTRADTTVIVAFLEFPADDAIDLRLEGWTQVPETRVLPDRLVLLGCNNGTQELARLGRPIPSGLALAPDPSAAPDDQIKAENGELKVDKGFEWVTDFARAVEVGMGFRVPLSPVAFRRGFDTLMVIGVRLRSNASAGAADLSRLLAHHDASKAGISILPQGRPTNNVEGEGAAYSWREDSDVSFNHYFGTPRPDPEDWFDKCDGRWLAELLGLSPDDLRHVPFYGRTDIRDARAMNVALWPATLGYFMDSMMAPVFPESTVERAREFFTRHVLARGPIPALRIGQQPYGILPATARSRIGWFKGARDEIGTSLAPAGAGEPFLAGLYRRLLVVDNDLTPLLGKVSWVGKPGADPHQALLDVLGLHPVSVEHQQRWAESIAHLFNRMSMQGAGAAFLAALIVAGTVQSGLQLLEHLGLKGGEGEKTPDILEKLFLAAPNALTGPLVDDRPLSETEALRDLSGDGNYIAWLRTAARTSHDALRKQEGFTDTPPSALLYLMMRHALDLSYVETSIRLFFNAGLLNAAELRAARREPEFIGIAQAGLAAPLKAGGSRWQYLYRTDPQVTGNPQRTVGSTIPTVLTGMAATAYLNRQIGALEHLAAQPTAALERAFVEHLDLCTYRHDAWWGGLLSHRLEALRFATEADGTVSAQSGLYLGAYGWLEAVRPEFKRLAPADLPDALKDAFAPHGTPVPNVDSDNQGFIHAPSLNHAVTAAVLRNGYLSNATPDNPGSLAVNLTSERVRLALSIIAGMKADQSLGALLGYHFERGLHDRHDVEVDAFILDLRKAFPLVADRLKPTRTGRTDALGRRLRINRIEARNVIDGLALVDHMRKTGDRGYPFGKSDELPAASPAQAAAISAEAERIAEIADAVADLALAESVHQVVQGNYDRAGAVLDTYSKGKFPATPDVIRTPRSGVTLTHRVALHLRTGLDPMAPALISPRAQAEPAIDDWLSGQLPAAANVAARVTITDPDSGATHTVVVSQSALGLMPIDLLYLLDTEVDGLGRALDDRIEAHVIANTAPPAHHEISIAYRERISPAELPGHVPFFELAALVRALRRVLLHSRPLRATDLNLAAEATESDDAQPILERGRIARPRGVLESARADLDTLRGPLQALIDAENRTQIISAADQVLADFVAALHVLAPFAGLQTGSAALFADRRRIFTALREKLAALILRWDGYLASFDAAIAGYDAAPGATEEDKLASLHQARRLVSTDRTTPPPPDPDDFRNALVGSDRVSFQARRDALAALLAGAATPSGLHDGIEASKGGNAAFDPQPIDIADEAARIVALVEDIAARARSLHDEVVSRRDAVDALLTEHDQAASGKQRVEALTRAARLLFGEDFQIVPAFVLSTPVGDEWSNAWGAGPAADRSLLGHLETTLGRRFPVDDWFIGVARVREKLHGLEAAGHLAGVLASGGIVLQPLQFPYRPEVPWLGLEYPDTRTDGERLEIDEGKLLYTAHWTEPFDRARPQAGLLVDEWTELIPSRNADTGIAFHYDRPNSEPPQTMLLALSPAADGGWRWADLVDTVHQTMDLAKKRAIEPDHIDTTAYARFLPALVSAVTLHPITAALNLAFNNNAAAALAQGARP